MNKKIAVIALIFILCLVNLSIHNKEKHLEDGEIVYLELAPVDPRSLMQGDYMALRFHMSDKVYHALPKSETRRRWRSDVIAGDGHVIATLDDRRVATFKRIYNGQPLSDNEILLQYRVRNGTVKFATNAFFFQEGDAEEYEQARYGQFRVNKKGEVLLTAMYTEGIEKIEPKDMD